jgi:hypothetical protein
MSEWTFAQKALLILASLELLWALAGFVAEPSFQIGADAPTTKVLFLYIAAALYITGFWALFEERPAYVFTFPSNVNGAIFHLVTAVVFSAFAAIQISRDRSVRSQPA